MRDLVILAHWRAQSYKFEQYTDLWDFCEELRKLKALSPQRLKACPGSPNSVQDAIDAVVGRETSVEGRQGKADKTTKASSFSIHTDSPCISPGPARAFSRPTRMTYQKLDFGRDSGWGDFLVVYLEKTKRELRKDDN